MIKILIYDDEKSYLTTMFKNDIKIELRDVQVFVAHSFDYFETLMGRHKFDAAILDIIGAENHINSAYGNEHVPPSFIGIELLKRIRKGFYSKFDQKADMPIYMRTARGEEPKIQTACTLAGANKIFEISEESDVKIIDLLRKKFFNEK